MKWGLVKPGAGEPVALIANLETVDRVKNCAVSRMKMVTIRGWKSNT
jgi:hypothetical protein